MDVVLERQTKIARQLFGDGATVGGSIGSAKHPGVLTIHVDGQPLGSGRTLQEALRVATRRAAGMCGSADSLLASDAA